MTTPAYNIAKLNFLVIEDADHMRTLVRTILNSLGAHVIREAANVPDAMAILSVSPVDIVICDWEMAPISGVDFVRNLRADKNSPYRFLPVIMLTGHSDMKHVTEARDAGVHEFVIKPIAAKTLYARIREIIWHPRPFVEAPNYFGPDRRRHQMVYAGPERRMANPKGDAGDIEAEALTNG